MSLTTKWLINYIFLLLLLENFQAYTHKQNSVGSKFQGPTVARQSLSPSYLYLTLCGKQSQQSIKKEPVLKASFLLFSSIFKLGDPNSHMLSGKTQGNERRKDNWITDIVLQIL